MLTDQHMGLKPGNSERHHELLGMPEGQDDPLVLPEHLFHMFGSLRAPGHCAAQDLNDLIADGRHHRGLEGVHHALQEGLFLRKR